MCPYVNFFFKTLMNILIIYFAIETEKKTKAGK